MQEISSFVNGQWFKNSSHFKKKFNPFTGELKTTYALASSLDIIHSLAALKKAQEEWQKSSIDNRTKALQGIRQWLQTHEQRVVTEEALQQGLHLDFVRKNTVGPLLQQIDQLILDLQKWDSATSWQWPAGLVAIVTPWPLAFRLSLERILPAIAAGNAVILKAPSGSPGSTALLGELLQSQSLTVVNIFLGDGTELVPLLAGHPSIRSFIFAGSTVVAERILPLALSKWKKISVSGSAKNSTCFLDAPASVPEMKKRLKSFLRGMGQTPWGSHQLFVLESHWNSIKEQILEVSQQWSCLENPEGTGDLSPLLTEDSLKSFLNRPRQVLQDEGHILCGAETIKSHFVRPLWTRDLPHCSELQTQDLEGPVFITSSVKYQHEMAKWINTSSFAHSAFLWGDPEKAQKLARQLQVGHLQINQDQDLIPSLGAFKQSAWGIQDFSLKSPLFSDRTLLI